MAAPFSDQSFIEAGTKNTVSEEIAQLMDEPD